MTIAEKTREEARELIKLNKQNRKTIRISKDELYSTLGKERLRRAYLKNLKEALLKEGYILGVGNKVAILTKDIS